MAPLLNPFIVGNVVKQPNFVGRGNEIFDLYQTIGSRQNKMVIGEPNVGKTSLLVHVTDQEGLKSQLPTGINWAFVLISGLRLPASITATQFWKRVLADAQIQWDDEALSAKLSPFMEASRLADQRLEKMFSIIAGHQCTLVLFLDEFDAMAGIPGLVDSNFWGPFRGVTSQSYGICFISASRESQAELIERLESHKAGGSPLLNIATQMRLGAFTPDEIDSFFTHMQGDEEVLKPQDIEQIKHIAGSHPFLLQLASYHFWNKRVRDGRITAEDYVLLRDKIVEAADAHFEDSWDFLGADESGSLLRNLILMLTLKWFNQRTHDLDALENALVNYAPEIDVLNSASLIRLEDADCHLANEAFAIWIYKNKLPAVLRNPDAWLNENRLVFGGLSRGQLNGVGELFRRVYGEFRNIFIETSARIPGNLDPY